MLLALALTGALLQEDVLFGTQSFDAFLFLGQSNMVGINFGRDVTPNGPERLSDRVFVLDRDDRIAPWHWPPPIALEEIDEPGTLLNIPPSISFVRRYAEAFSDRRILMIQVAVNSSGFSTGTEAELNWAAPGSTFYRPGNLHDLALQRASEAVAQGATLRAVCWHQGETDSLALTGPEYQAELRNLVLSLRSQLPPDALGTQEQLPFVFGGMTDFGAATLPQLPMIDTALQFAAMQIPNCTYVSAEGLLPFDDIHLNGPSSRVFGRRLAMGLLNVDLDLTPVPGPTLAPPLAEGLLGPFFQQVIDPLDSRTLFPSYSGTVAAPFVPTSLGYGNYSDLSNFERYRNNDGFFYLRLTWASGQSVLWRQRSNPFQTPHQVVVGFELSPIDSSGFQPFQFRGLSRFPDSGRVLGLRPGSTSLLAPTLGIHSTPDTQNLAQLQAGNIVITPDGQATFGVRLESVSAETFAGLR